MKHFMALALVTFLFFGLNTSFAADTTSAGIKFEHGSWAEVVTKAKQENKIIFMDAFASWCGPCKWMVKNIFPNDTVAEFYNKNFVSSKFDMEKGEGIELAKKFGVRAYPTFLYISPDGETLLHRTCGSCPADEFLKNGQDALDPEKQLFTARKNFEKATPSAKDAYIYFGKLESACMSFDQELSKYLESQKESDLASKDNWKIIFTFLSDPSSKTFKRLLTDKKQFADLYGQDLVDKKIRDVYNQGLLNAIRQKDDNKFNSLSAELKKSGNPEAEKVILSARLRKFEKEKDWKNYAKAAVTYAEKFCNDNYVDLNKIAWNLSENVADKKVLQKAEKWARRAVELQNNYSINDTYANVLYKLGKKHDALAAAQKAIDLGKAGGEDTKATEELVQKINQLR